MFTTTSKAKNTYGQRRRRRYRKKGNLDKKITRVARQVVAKEMADEVEHKAYSRADIVSTISDAGSVFSISNTLSQGDGITERIGDKIKIKSLFCRLNVNAASAATYNTLRLIIFRWNSAGTPTVGDILSLTTTATIRHLSQLNYLNRRLYQIKYDNTYIVSDNASIDILAIQTDKFYIKTFGDAYWGAASTTPVKGHIYCLAISDSAVNLPQLALVSRVKYTDM